MTGLEIAALVAGAAWLGVLSLVALLCVRQIAILTVRADNAVAIVMDEDGLPLGVEVPAEVTEAVPDARRNAIVVLMSATCGPCREVAATMDGLAVPDPITVLLTGDSEQRDVVQALLPPGVATLADPLAARLAGHLKIRSSPFAMRLAEGTVVAKAYLSESRTLERLYEQPQAKELIPVKNASETNLEVVGSVD
jgi:hypothetical protein